MPQMLSSVDPQLVRTIGSRNNCHKIDLDNKKRNKQETGVQIFLKISGSWIIDIKITYLNIF